MSRNSDDIIRKIGQKWTDDIKKDVKFVGVGSVNNQTHLANGAKMEKPSDDRSFSYEFKENQIYAFGLLDGYNGSWTVDLVDQYILTNMYFDHLETLQKKTDEEVFEILKNEFHKTDRFVVENAQEIMLRLSLLNISQEENKNKSTPEYIMNQKEIKLLNSQINSGTFSLVALIIDNRLFIGNIGPVNCFVCCIDKTNKNKLKVIPLQTDHTVLSTEEVIRLVKLKADITDLDSVNDLDIKYTRCLGDFKLKTHFQQYEIFSKCTQSPIIAQPDFPPGSLLVDENYLFMGIYTDSVQKAILETDSNVTNTDVRIAEMLMNKIISEQTLNSASQSVLDEIKRSYDDKFISSYMERDDFTLVLRSFDVNLKSRLKQIQNQIKNHNEVFETLEKTNLSSFDSNNTATNLSDNVPDQEDEENNEEENVIQSLIDTDDKVKAYVDFNEINEIIQNDPEFEMLTQELRSLAEQTEQEQTTRI